MPSSTINSLELNRRCNIFIVLLGSLGQGRLLLFDAKPKALWKRIRPEAIGSLPIPASFHLQSRRLLNADILHNNAGIQEIMSSIGTTRGKWELTGEAFTKFLARLDAKPERAGEQYEVIRLALAKFFDWQGAFAPEDLADEVINRVARKIDEGDALRDVPSYCHGVARLVLLEHRKNFLNRRAEVEEINAFAAAEQTAEGDERPEYLEQCLQELPVESRQLVLRYYQDERRRKIDVRAAMADQLGIPLNALRSRVQRLRERLEQCVKGHLAKRKF